MVRPVLLLVAAAVAGCTAPAYSCGHPVPCARGSVQSCTSRDGQRCRYLLSDGTTIECASCDDCFAAEREITDWCANDVAVGGGGGGASPDLSTVGVAPDDMAASTSTDLAGRPPDLSWTPPADQSGPVDTDLGCYAFPYDCQGDPACCSHCCAGGCAVSGNCALY